MTSVKRLARLALALLCFVYDAISMAIRQLAGIPRDPFCVVLYYHDIMEATQARFAQQMDTLLQVCRLLPAGWDGDIPRGSRFAVVTVDDGYASILRTAVPELLVRRIPFTVFIPTGFLGRDPTWHQQGAKLPRVMDETEVKWLSQQELATIGAHTVHHVDLRSISKDEVVREMAGSKLALETLIGREVKLFSFPFGSFAPEHQAIGLSLGYLRLFTSHPTLWPSGTNAHFVGRIRVEPTDWGIEFALKIRGAWRWMASISAIKITILGAIQRIFGMTTRRLFGRPTE